MTQREATIGQIIKLGVRVQEAIPTIGLTFDGAQAHIGSDVLTEAVKVILKAHPNAVDLGKLREMLSSYIPFGDEELTDSEFGYPDGFPKKTWQQRLQILRDNFGGLYDEGLDEFIALLQSRGVDDWVDDSVNPYLVPDWRAVGETYAQATVIAWKKLAESPTYNDHAYNYREDALTEDRLRLVDEAFYRQLSQEWGYQLRGIPTATAHERLRMLRPGPQSVWPLFAQTGLRHRGRSVRRSHICFTATEWGLGPFEVACILLTDGEDRLTVYEHLGIDAPGAFYKPEDGGTFGSYLCFRFYDALLRLRGGWISLPDRSFGSPSASLR